MQKLILSIQILLLNLLLASCMDDTIIPASPLDLYGSRGVFIVNEGNYLYGNASISYYDFASNEVIPDVFSMANGIPLGDVAYSMVIKDSKGYIVVNNSGCIYIVDANTLTIEGQIDGLISPRHILMLNEHTLLVSDLYARGISVIDIPSRRVIGKIPTGGASLPFHQHSTENLIGIGKQILTNCWSFDNKILSIDAERLAITDSVEVGVQPLSMVADANGKVWVMNDGGYPGNPFGFEKASLMRLNPTTLEVELRLDFASATDMAGQIATNPAGDTLYYICNHLFRMPIDRTTLPSVPFVQRNGRNFRALGIDTQTGNIFISDATDYLSDGMVYVYKSSGELIANFETGVVPTAFCFN